MTLSWDTAAWEDFQYWLDTDKAMARKLRALLKECLRTPQGLRIKIPTIHFQRLGALSVRKPTPFSC